MSSGEFFGNVEERCARFGVPAVPHLVGAVYYIEPGDAARDVFDCARDMERRYDELGFRRLRNRPNEEPLLSVAMARLRQEVIPDDGFVKSDAMAWDHVRCDALRGTASVETRDKRRVQPRILHFNDSFANRPPYTSECLKLKLVSRYGMPAMLARACAAALVEWPRAAEAGTKDALRPLYHSLFGARRVRSARP
jgi:hypothetical protein